MRRVPEQDSPFHGVGARVIYEKDRAGNSALHTRNERKALGPPAGGVRRCGAVIARYSDVLGERGIHPHSYALICNTSWFSSRANSGRPTCMASKSAMY